MPVNEYGLAMPDQPVPLVVERRGDDYFGLPLSRVARLLSAGHGGQILLSEPTVEAAEHLPAVSLVCGNCGFMMMFSAKLVGLR